MCGGDIVALSQVTFFVLAQRFYLIAVGYISASGFVRNMRSLPINRFNQSGAHRAAYICLDTLLTTI